MHRLPVAWSASTRRPRSAEPLLAVKSGQRRARCHLSCLPSTTISRHRPSTVGTGMFSTRCPHHSTVLAARNGCRPWRFANSDGRVTTGISRPHCRARGAWHGGPAALVKPNRAGSAAFLSLGTAGNFRREALPERCDAHEADAVRDLLPSVEEIGAAAKSPRRWSGNTFTQDK